MQKAQRSSHVVDMFPRPQYNFSNCNVQIHNHYGQSAWTIDSWHCDTSCPLKVIRFFEETDIYIFFERTILSACCQFCKFSHVS